MSDLKICRICLESNVRMHLILGSEVQDVYEKLTSKKVEEASTPHYACYMCFHQLEKCQLLVTKSKKSDDLLRLILAKYIEDRESVCVVDRKASGLVNFSIAPTECFSLYEDVKEEIKCEEKEMVYVPDQDSSDSESWPKPMKEESLTINNNTSIENNQLTQNKVIGQGSSGSKDYNISDSDYLMQATVKREDADNASKARYCDSNDASADDVFKVISSDSEDDVPLKRLRTEPPERGNTEMNTDKEKVEAREVILTKEQQIEELRKRSELAEYIESQWKCTLCYTGFGIRMGYDNHMRKHDRCSGIYQCEICKLRYRKKHLLYGHIEAMHARLYKCNRCEHEAHTLKQARAHSKMHTYDCKICGKWFNKPTTLLAHKKSQHPKRYFCDICGKNFVKSLGLALHLTAAHNQKGVKDAIPARFHRERTVRCKVCYQILPTKSISSHMKEHTRRKRKYACELCDAMFVSVGYVKNHMNKVHSEAKYRKKYVCEECDMKFLTQISLKLHQEKTHTNCEESLY